MSEQDVAVQLENHDNHIKSLEKRMDKQEKKSEVLNDLAMSIQKLAFGMDSMNKKQDSMSIRLEEIEKRPAQAWNTMTRTIFTTIVSAVAGGIAVWIVQGIAMNVH